MSNQLGIGIGHQPFDFRQLLFVPLQHRHLVRTAVLRILHQACSSISASMYGSAASIALYGSVEIRVLG